VSGHLDGQLRKAIRDVPDYPKVGIVFKDLTTLWKDGPLTRRVLDELEGFCRSKSPNKIVGVEARGFIVGAPLADRLGVGFVPARKTGKLPTSKVTVDYSLEYGKQGLEMHSDGIVKGDRVVIVDDLLATGGTSEAAKRLVEKLGGEVAGFAFVAELTYLKGRERLGGHEVFTIARYDS
jgi:adenine phosphoribosyltransferase